MIFSQLILKMECKRWLKLKHYYIINIVDQLTLFGLFGKNLHASYNHLYFLLLFPAFFTQEEFLGPYLGHHFLAYWTYGSAFNAIF